MMDIIWTFLEAPPLPDPLPHFTNGGEGARVFWTVVGFRWGVAMAIVWSGGRRRRSRGELCWNWAGWSVVQWGMGLEISKGTGPGIDAFCDHPGSDAPPGREEFLAYNRGRHQACPRLISDAPPGQGTGEGTQANYLGIGVGGLWFNGGWDWKLHI